MAQSKLLLLGLVSLFLAVGSGSAQTVTIVSGQGQLNCAFFCPAGFDPLVIAVKDANGAPLANATIAWVVSGQGAITDPATGASGLNVTTTTDANGRGSVQFSQQGGQSFGFYFFSSTVTATVGTGSAVFYETTANVNNGAVLVNPQLLQPVIGSTISGQSGTQLAGAVQINVGGGVSGVAVQLTPVDSSTPLNASCVASPGQPAGIVLSDSSGLATCNVIFGPALGTYPFNITVGGNYKIFQGFSASVTPGLPCTMSIVSGDKQSGNPGQNLSSPLVAKVGDCGGNPLDAVPVTWTVSPAGGATLFNSRTTSANGSISTNLTLGSIPGAVTITAAVAAGTQTGSSTPVQVSFTANVNVTISNFQKLSGDGQDAAQNTQFANPLVVQVNSQSQPLANVAVNFAVVSGTATVSTSSVATNAQGQASVTVTAGATPGPVVVNATIAGYSTTLSFNLTVRQPGPTNVTFLNGAGFQPNFIAPCSIATIMGSGLAPGVQGIVAPAYVGPLLIQVANVTVQFGSTYAPIYYVSNVNGQQSVTVQVPCEATPGSTVVTIRVNGASANFNTTVMAVAPGIFETVMSDGKRRGVVLKPDGSYVSLENPARKGEILRVYVTGLGNTVSPAISTNSPGIPDTDSVVNDLSAIVVGVNNFGVRVVSARYARGLIGVYEVAFQVPVDAASGDLNLAVAVYQSSGSLLFGNSSKLPVQ